MPAIPRDPRFDSSLALLADPYRYIGRRCRQQGTDLFEARILLRPTICMSGPRAAELFYDLRRFRRRGAAPEPLRATLFGKGGVQGLDGAAHRHRKAMFMGLLTPERVAELASLVAGEWLLSAQAWTENGQVHLYRALHLLLARAVCSWAGVPLLKDELDWRAAQLAALFDAAAGGAAAHLRSRAARRRTEHWLARLVREVRAGRQAVVDDSPLHVVAWHRDLDGDLLVPRVAAVELLNLLRPTVAASVFVVFAAHALHLHPRCRAALRSGDPAYAENFAHEVRRWYPFFPAVVARVEEDFEWEGYCFPHGRRVMLDLYGTNHDPRAWSGPELFRPERFLQQTPPPYAFIPQGGAEAAGHHRCPGEGAALAVIRTSVDFLVNRLEYRVPAQDLDIDFSRLPALPKSGFVIDDVRLSG